VFKAIQSNSKQNVRSPVMTIYDSGVPRHASKRAKRTGTLAKTHKPPANTGLARLGTLGTLLNSLAGEKGRRGGDAIGKINTAPLRSGAAFPQYPPPIRNFQALSVVFDFFLPPVFNEASKSSPAQITHPLCYLRSLL